MYIRFVLPSRDDMSGKRSGIFVAAYQLRKRSDLSAYHAESLREQIGWFEDNLNRPTRFNRTNSKGYYRRNTKGLSWFKPTATDYIRRMFELATVLEAHDYSISIVKTHRPGYIVFEDNHQIVAEPFRDTGA